VTLRAGVALLAQPLVAAATHNFGRVLMSGGRSWRPFLLTLHRIRTAMIPQNSNEVPLTEWAATTLAQAREFDTLIRKLIPYYSQMVDALVSAIPFQRSAPIQVMDIGCGTGTVAAAVLGSFPNARLTCLDLAEGMIAMAKIKLADHAAIRYIVSDIASHQFDQAYDAIVSSLALHHMVSDAEKQRICRRIYESLAPGGVFYNADVVLGSNDSLQGANMRQWCAFMRRHITPEEVDGKWIPKYYAEDYPAKLVDQLKWLGEIGFSEMDVIWKYYNFAVYGGTKPCGR
jgi:tRNA (cmo5U34)-methyltransferase